MGIPNQVPLDIIELAFYAPALVVSLLVVRRHGVKREAGWRFLVLLSLARLIGAGTGIAAAYDTTNRQLIEASDICGSIGVSMLLGAALGILTRINDKTDERRLPQHGMRLVYLPILVGLILNIYGSTQLFSVGNPSTVSNGFKFVKAGSALFALGLILLWGILLFSAANIGKVEQTERRLVWLVAFSMPWQTIRVVYTLICAFSENSKYFSQFSTNTTAIIVHGIMGFSPEIVVMVTYLWAGMRAKRLERNVSEVKAPAYTEGPPMNGMTFQRGQQV